MLERLDGLSSNQISELVGLKPSACRELTVLNAVSHLSSLAERHKQSRVCRDGLEDGGLYVFLLERLHHGGRNLSLACNIGVASQLTDGVGADADRP